MSIINFLSDLSQLLIEVFLTHAPNLVAYAKEEAPQLLYPVSAKAIIEGIYAYIECKCQHTLFELIYMEESDGGHVIDILCPNMTEEDFPDPDYVDNLHELYDELSIFKTNQIALQLKGDHKEIVKILSPRPLETLELIKGLFLENTIFGIEDCINYWCDDSMVKGMLGDYKEDVLPDNEEREDPANFRRMKHAVLSHYYGMMARGKLAAINDLVESDDYQKGSELMMIPMTLAASSERSVFTQMAIADNAESACSIAELEAKIRNELNCKNRTLPELNRDSRFIIH